MNITTILIIVNVFASIAITALVLMQQSKGDMGSAFGGGGSSSMFGSKGSANFLTRCTSTMVTLFFLSSLILAYVYAKRNAQDQEIAPISIEQSSEIPSIDSVVDDLSNEVPSTPEEVPSIPSVDSQTEQLTEDVDQIIDEAQNAVEEVQNADESN